MGVTTPNIGIYIPAAGETNYDASFSSGMVNVDQHDHSGGPNKGVKITTSGLSDGSVTYNILASNVADTTTGIGVSGVAGPNQLSLLGFLKNLYAASLVPSVGFVCMNGAAANIRTITGTAGSVVVTPSAGDGAASSLVLSVPFGTTGYPGEVISSFVNSGSGVSLTNNTPVNITSISLSPGTWLVSALLLYSTHIGSVTGTQYISSISTTSATTGTGGLNTVYSLTSPNNISDVTNSIPAVIITVAPGPNQTVYLVSNQLFSAGAVFGYGNITAIRLK